MPHVTPATDPGSKDSLARTTVPAIPRRKVGSHTLDNASFSSVQKRVPVSDFKSPVSTKRRSDLYLRLPGLQTRPIRPRDFIYQLDADYNANRTAVAPKETAADGVTNSTTTFTSTTATFQTNLVNNRDFLIIAGSSGSVGQFRIVKVVSETEVTLFPAVGSTDATLTYYVMQPNSFPVVTNDLIERGFIEIRNSTIDTSIQSAFNLDVGTQQTLIVPV